MKRRAITGQIALVTGASSGVGWQVACRLAAEGARLCLTARRREPLEKLAQELTKRGADVIIVPGDVTRPDDVDAVVAACLERFGRIDLLVNVPSVQLFARFEDYRWDEITRVMDVNFFGYLRTTRTVLPVFRRQGSGHIINVLSVFSQMGFPLFSIYAASKHALLGWADSLRLELQGSGIDISNVLLPSIATPFYDVAPTKLDRNPRPPPPVYTPELAAGAVARCARHPNPHYVPVLLQGKLAFLLRRLAPALVDPVLGRWGARWVTGPTPVHRREGNLFLPDKEHYGPKGTVRATPAWAMMLLGAMSVAGIVGLAGGITAAALRVRAR